MRSTQVLSWRSARQKARIVRGLEATEVILADVADAYRGRLGVAGAATLRAGGKRVRPLLVLLAARRTRPFDGPVLRAAAAVELLHMATLVHDDVLDGAELRRGRPTVAHEAGVAVATSVGNYLLAQAFAQLAATGDARAVDLLSDVALGLSEGELLQMREAYLVTLTEDDYIRRCELKTADLFAACGRLGAMLSGLDAQSVGALGDFGRSLGLAFQIFDDILDLTGDEARTGKRVGTDLRDGTVTLPVILALQERPAIGPRLQRCGHDEQCLQAVAADVAATGALDRAREMALGLVAAALRSLDECSPDVERGLLANVAASVVDRFS